MSMYTHHIKHIFNENKLNIEQNHIIQLYLHVYRIWFSLWFAGPGKSKKVAKRNAAQAMVQLLRQGVQAQPEMQDPEIEEPTDENMPLVSAFCLGGGEGGRLMGEGDRLMGRGHPEMQNSEMEEPADENMPLVSGFVARREGGVVAMKGTVWDAEYAPCKRFFGEGRDGREWRLNVFIMHIM